MPIPPIRRRPSNGLATVFRRTLQDYRSPWGLSTPISLGLERLLHRREAGSRDRERARGQKIAPTLQEQSSAASCSGCRWPCWPRRRTSGARSGRNRNIRFLATRVNPFKHRPAVFLAVGRSRDTAEALTAGLLPGRHQHAMTTRVRTTNIRRATTSVNRAPNPRLRTPPSAAFLLMPAAHDGHTTIATAATRRYDDGVTCSTMGLFCIRPTT